MREDGPRERGSFPGYGWLGAGLIAVFWPLNWFLDGPRTHVCFFPLWLGYCLLVDGLARRRHGTSLIARGPVRYVALFLVSVPLWWVFEAINLRTRNWSYVGGELFGPVEYALLASLNFSTVVPAVLGSAELAAGLRRVRALPRGPELRLGTRGAALLLASGAGMLGLVLAWPDRFYPLVWLSLFCLCEPVNRLLGHRSLIDSLARGDWRPVIALIAGVSICGLLWEMWNFLSYPKWIYRVPGFEFAHVFEMPLAGYFGYWPFSLEVLAMVHLAFGLAGRGRSDYVTRGLSA